MSAKIPYMPQAVFSSEKEASVPRVFIAPQRYVQGDGILDHLGRYLSIVPSERVAILIDKEGQERDGARLLKSLSSTHIESEVVTFNGECSTEEIDRVVEILQTMAIRVDCVVAVGGGKCLDVGKGVAHRLAMPVVNVPTPRQTQLAGPARAVVGICGVSHGDNLRESGRVAYFVAFALTITRVTGRSHQKQPCIISIRHGVPESDGGCAGPEAHVGHVDVVGDGPLKGSNNVAFIADTSVV